VTFSEDAEWKNVQVSNHSWSTSRTAHRDRTSPARTIHRGERSSYRRRTGERRPENGRTTAKEPTNGRATAEEPTNGRTTAEELTNHDGEPANHGQRTNRPRRRAGEPRRRADEPRARTRRNYVGSTTKLRPSGAREGYGPPGARER